MQGHHGAAWEDPSPGWISRALDSSSEELFWTRSWRQPHLSKWKGNVKGRGTRNCRWWPRFWDVQFNLHFFNSGCMLEAPGELGNNCVHPPQTKSIWTPPPGGGSVTQSCRTLRDPTDCSLPGSSVHRISQARILEWAATLFSRGSSQTRDWSRTF